MYSNLTILRDLLLTDKAKLPYPWDKLKTYECFLPYSYLVHISMYTGAVQRAIHFELLKQTKTYIIAFNNIRNKITFFFNTRQKVIKLGKKNRFSLLNNICSVIILSLCMAIQSYGV